MKHVLLLAGGPSSEREVSISSSQNIKSVLEELGYMVSVLDPADDLLLKNIGAIKPDVVYNGLHGTYGEDGLVQSILEIAGIPYTHSSVCASSVAMNKTLTKRIVSAYGVNVPHSIEMDVQEYFAALLNHKKIDIDMPYVIKPVAQGSTVGVYMIASLEDEEKMLTCNWNHGNSMIIEKYIPGKELSVAVLRGKALGVVEIVSPEVGIWSYHAKYISDKTKYIIPADIPKEVYELAMCSAEIAHKKLTCRTISRSDFRYNNNENQLCDGSGIVESAALINPQGSSIVDNERIPNMMHGLYFLELNTQPGMMMGHSLFPKIAEHYGITFANLLQILIEDACCKSTLPNDVRLLEKK